MSDETHHHHEVPPPPAEGWKHKYVYPIFETPGGTSTHRIALWLTIVFRGVAVIPGDNLDTNTASTPCMDRAAAINKARVGAQKLWAGTVHIHANAKTGAHHHGHLEVCRYPLLSFSTRRWGQ